MGAIHAPRFGSGMKRPPGIRWTCRTSSSKATQLIGMGIALLAGTSQPFGIAERSGRGASLRATLFAAARPKGPATLAKLRM